MSLSVLGVAPLDMNFHNLNESCPVIKKVKLGVLCITFPFLFIIVAAYDFVGCTS